MAQLPDELEQLMDCFDEGNFGVRILQVEDRDELMTIHVELRGDAAYHDAKETQQWRIEAVTAADISVDFRPASFLDLTDDHPLLWEHNESWRELYFRGNSEAPERVVLRLLQLHSETFDEMIPLSRYIMSRREPGWLLRQGHGLIARGPARFVDRVAEIMHDEGFATSSIATARNSATNAGGFSLLRIGNSYIIAAEFKFTRL